MAPRNAAQGSGRTTKPPTDDPRTCSAREAAETLGISMATLYAYVSRGLVRSEAGAGSSRARRYHREDIARLKEGKAQRRDPARAAARALDMGAPVLESALTLIAGERMHYRGRDAVVLTRTHTLERIAGLLWLDDDDAARAEALFAGAPSALTRNDLAAISAPDNPAERFQVALAIAAARDTLAWDLRPAAVAQTGARILQLLVGVAAGDLGAPVSEQRGTFAERLARAWAPRVKNAASLIDAALIACADHELNVSAFTARCVASADAAPWQVVIAGLAALQGNKHGGHTRRADALMAEIASMKGDLAKNTRNVLMARLKDGRGLPGFGHPLYPQCDPRAALLLELAAAGGTRPAALALSRQVARTAESLGVEKPNVDFGLATLGHALGLPAGSAFALFALGRTVGWVAHAIEQYALDTLIRPRARYVGVQPQV
jgi:citrate synthase